MELKTSLSSGSIVMIDAGQAFIIMEKEKGFTIAEVSKSGIEAKEVYFASLVEMEAWFNESESKIAKVLAYNEHLMQLYRLAEEMVEPMKDVTDESPSDDRTIESLQLSVRTYNCLKRAGVNCESQIRKMSYEEITKIRNLSRKGLYEIEQALDIQFS